MTRTRDTYIMSDKVVPVCPMSHSFVHNFCQIPVLREMVKISISDQEIESSVIVNCTKLWISFFRNAGVTEPVKKIQEANSGTTILMYSCRMRSANVAPTVRKRGAVDGE
jgi:hypothetical protein